jgi:hypothetical protein
MSDALPGLPYQPQHIDSPSIRSVLTRGIPAVDLTLFRRRNGAIHRFAANAHCSRLISQFITMNMTFRINLLAACCHLSRGEAFSGHLPEGNGRAHSVYPYHDAAGKRQ